MDVVRGRWVSRRGGREWQRPGIWDVPAEGDVGTRLLVLSAEQPCLSGAGAFEVYL